MILSKYLKKFLLTFTVEDWQKKSITELAKELNINEVYYIQIIAKFKEIGLINLLKNGLDGRKKFIKINDVDTIKNLINVAKALDNDFKDKVFYV